MAPTSGSVFLLDPTEESLTLRGSLFQLLLPDPSQKRAPRDQAGVTCTHLTCLSASRKPKALALGESREHSNLGALHGKAALYTCAEGGAGY